MLLAALLLGAVPLHAQTEVRRQLRFDPPAGATLDAPVENRFFLPVADHSAALHPFEGSLTIVDSTMHDTAPASAHTRNRGLRLFPEFEAHFFSHDGALVPLERTELQPDGLHFWRIILGVGRTWSEAGDGGMSRASFPFTLVAPWDNTAHNGVATFLYNDESVSPLLFQVTQETSPHARYDFWGRLDAEYRPGAIPNREQNLAAYATELEQQLPIRPWSELEGRFVSEALEGFDGPLEPADISASGVVIDGVIYLRTPMTRHGPYPYPRELRSCVYSVSKSMGTGAAMLRLAQLYGADVFDLRIADLLDVRADHDGWNDVTFGDALNMAVGVGDGAPQRRPFAAHVDENSGGNFSRWYDTLPADDKLTAAFAFGDLPWGPGEVLRYNSAHTYILVAAMDAYLKQQQGPEANIWDFLMDEVYRPIGAPYLSIRRTWEEDGSDGLPLFHGGMRVTVEELARFSTLIQQGGVWQGEQLLHPVKLAEALRRSDAIGLPSGISNRYGDDTYLASYWAVAYRGRDGSFVEVPLMSGYGGNQVVVAPNGVTAFRFADAMDFDVLPLIRVAEVVGAPFEGVRLPLQLMPVGVWRIPEAARFVALFEVVLWIWFALLLLFLLVIAWRLRRAAVGAAGWLRWLLVTVLVGPFALIGRALVERQTDVVPVTLRGVTGSVSVAELTATTLIGFGVGMKLALWAITSVPALDRGVLLPALVIYLLPLAAALVVAYLPLARRIMGRRGWPRALLAGAIATQLVLALAVSPLQAWSNRAPVPLMFPSPMAWMLIGWALALASLLLYPFHRWLLRDAGSLAAPLPGIRRCWPLGLGSLVLLVAGVLLVVALSG
ncbi:MAG: serine hydrolase [Trueperaceae bacterium]|nr:MAG: serine hydrolase [Trueperaceae bacterium]